MRVAVINDQVLRFDGELAAERHGVAGVDGEIEEDLLELAGVGFDAAEGIAEAQAELDVFTNQAAEELAHVGDEFVEVEDLGLKDLHAAEGEHLAGEGSGAVGCFANLLATAVEGLVGLQAVEKQIAVAADYGEQVVEVVGDAACHAAEGFHFLGLAELAFELSALRFVALQRVAHPIKSTGQFRQFIMAAGFEGIFHVATLECVNTFYEGSEGAGGGAGDDGHEAQAEEEMIESLEIGVGFEQGLENDDVRDGLQARGEFDGAGVIAFIAQDKFGGNKLVGKAAGEFRFLQHGKRADGNFTGFAEDDVAGGDARKIRGSAFVDQPADDDKAEEIFARGAVIERLKNNLIKARTAEPPARSFFAIDGTGNHFLGAGDGEGRGGGMERNDFCIFVCKDEKTAVIRLPGVFAGVANGGGIAVTHVGERGEQIGLAAKRGFLLAVDGLDSEGGVLRVAFDLEFDLCLRVAAYDEKGNAGESGGEKDEGKEELGAQAEIGGAVTQEVCDRAAGQEPGAELVVRHRASRVRNERMSENGTIVPISRYEE